MGEGGAAFTDVEFHFLASIGHGRLVTIGPDGAPQVHPTAFAVDADSGSLEISGSQLRDSQKYRNVRRDPRVSLTVEDPSHPLRGFDDRDGRGVEIHGFAELSERSGVDIILIHPVRLELWNVQDIGHRSRFT
ncbi:MAG: hypothetical protein JWR11_2376 [Mycobacterium sp.]|nr:hypothetical protein [Mycobacterium sp.]MDT5175998.1 pyridoxamine 5-phosphate oxidase family protein [Mycobacterium sp.]